MKVSLFVTCLVDTVAPQVGVATVRLLERLGHQVEFPREQTCCGQMHLNTGYRDAALPLARQLVRTFADAEVIVAPSASCVATVRELYRDLATSDDKLAAEVELLAPRMFELSELLVGHLGLEDVGATYPHRVTYHPTCHSLRLLGLGDAPTRLLRNVRGIELVELPGASECCGFGGTFAVKNAETSTAIVDDKVSAIRATGAEVCVAADASCLMHIGGRLSRLGAPVRTAHIAEVLAETAA
jgi:L-lactate dehydrogenase complex protein LldE